MKIPTKEARGSGNFKDYGNLTTEQFKRLISKLPELRAQEKDLFIELKRGSKVDALLDKDFH